MKVVFFNLKNAGIDVNKQRHISTGSLMRAIKNYFNLKTDKTAKEYIKRMVEKGYLETGFGSFKITDSAIAIFGKN